MLWETQNYMREDKNMTMKQKIKNLITKFHPINFDEWERKWYFYYFTKRLPTAISIGVGIANTCNMIKKAKQKNFFLHICM